MTDQTAPPDAADGGRGGRGDSGYPGLRPAVRAAAGVELRRGLEFARPAEELLTLDLFLPEKRSGAPRPGIRVDPRRWLAQQGGGGEGALAPRGAPGRARLPGREPDLPAGPRAPLPGPAGRRAGGRALGAAGRGRAGDRPAAARRRRGIRGRAPGGAAGDDGRTAGGRRHAGAVAGGHLRRLRLLPADEFRRDRRPQRPVRRRSGGRPRRVGAVAAGPGGLPRLPGRRPGGAGAAAARHGRTRWSPSTTRSPFSAACAHWASAPT